MFLVLFWLGTDLEKQKDGATDMHETNCSELLSRLGRDGRCDTRTRPKVIITVGGWGGVEGANPPIKARVNTPRRTIDISLNSEAMETTNKQLNV